MDEQEVPENSSQEISKDETRSSEDATLSPAETAAPASKPSAEQGSSNKDGDPDEIGIGLPPEELPTMQWSDVYAELAEFEELQPDGQQENPAPTSGPQQPDQTGPLEGLEEAMNWLEELAAGQGMPIDEMPTLVTAQKVPSEEQQVEEDVLQTPSVDESAAPALELDSDPMAWLEQLAVDQSSPLEELPSVADRLLASEIVSQTAIPPNSTINDPYDVDQALGYLEQLAVAQGVDLTGVTFDSEQPVDSLNAALNIIDGLALTGLTAAAVAPDPEITVGESEDILLTVEDPDLVEMQEPEQPPELSSTMPDDPQQALDWLSNIGEEDDVPIVIVEESDTTDSQVEATAPDDLAVESEYETPEMAEEEPQFDADALEEMPDDPDEAIAWMEHLATRGSQKPEAEAEAAVSPKEESSSSAAESTEAWNESLLEAQAALDDGDLDKALSNYQTLLDQDAATDELAASLEDAVANHEDSPGLLRLLGDTYMKMGQVDKAIETYRRGFDHL